MKTIALIGGMSWESTLMYYRLLNETVKQKLGGLHSAKCILYSMDFAEVEMLQREGRWVEAGQLLAAAAKSLEAAGADCVLLCTNTMHKVADAIQAGVTIPLLHIADATGAAIQQAGLHRVALLGTRFTMEEDFYRGHLVLQFGLDVMLPNPEGRERVHQIIYDELCMGQIKPDSKADVVKIIQQLVRQGAEGIILGCTELGLLMSAADCPVPLFDTTRIHAQAAVKYAMRKENGAAGL